VRTPTQTARAIHQAHVRQDRAAAEELIAADLVVTSPLDDHIDRATSFTRCFPTADRFVTHELGAVSEVEPRVVLVTYS
jgi:hypothetical protein